MYTYAILLKLRSLVYSILFPFFAYFLPALFSTKAVICRDDDDLKEWLTYWSVFSFFILTEFICDFMLEKIYFYYELKIGLVCWLTLPRTQGVVCFVDYVFVYRLHQAFKLYNSIVKPYFDKYEDDIDKKIDIVASDLRQRAFRQLKRIAWAIFIGADSTSLLAPMQTLMAGADKFLGTGSSASIVEVKEKGLTASPSYDGILTCLEQSHITLQVGTDGLQFSHFQCRFHGKSSLYLELISRSTAAASCGDIDAISGHKLRLPLAHAPGGELCLHCFTSMEKGPCDDFKSTSCSRTIYYVPLYAVNSVYEGGPDVVSEESPVTDVVGIDIINPVTHDCIALYLRQEEYEVRTSQSNSTSTSSDLDTKTTTVSVTSSQLTSCLHVASSNARGKLWRRLRLAVRHISKAWEGESVRKRFKHWVEIIQSIHMQNDEKEVAIDYYGNDKYDMK